MSSFPSRGVLGRYWVLPSLLLLGAFRWGPWCTTIFKDGSSELAIGPVAPVTRHIGHFASFVPLPVLIARLLGQRDTGPPQARRPSRTPQGSCAQWRLTRGWERSAVSTAFTVTVNDRTCSGQHLCRCACRVYGPPELRSPNASTSCTQGGYERAKYQAMLPRIWASPRAQMAASAINCLLDSLG